MADDTPHEEVQQASPGPPPLQDMPDSLAARLIAALGLPAHTYMLELLFVAEQPVSIRCHYYPDEEAMRQAVALFAEYQLVAKQQLVVQDEAQIVKPHEID